MYKQIDWCYRHLLKPILFKMDEEDAHDLAKRAMPYLPTAERVYSGGEHLFDQSLLSGYPINSFLDHPIGLAAGFDKTGELAGDLHKFGFSFAELGSVTFLGSMGNTRPRMFRIPENESIVNCMGLNGPSAVDFTVSVLQKPPKIPYGISIARSNQPNVPADGKDEALSVFTTAALGELRNPPKYYALNISCPNSQHDVIGSLDLEHAHDKLAELLENVVNALERAKVERFSTPLLFFLKLSPDSPAEWLRIVANLSAIYPVDGFICGNTTKQHPFGRIGGASGKHVRQLNLDLCKYMRMLCPNKFIIGCGGISIGEDVLAYKHAGANLYQIYSSLIFDGPYSALRIAEEYWMISRNNFLEDVCQKKSLSVK